MRGPLVGIPIRRFPDVTRSDRLKGNVSVTYVTFCVLKEGTETSCPIATAAVPPLSGRVTSSTPQRKPEYALHLLPTYTYAVVSGNWIAIIACQCALGRRVSLG